VPKILDFGLATILRGRIAGGTTTTQPAADEQGDDLDGSVAEAEKHGLAGTPLYMSPEALSGAAPRPTFDVWSLTVVLFEAMAGRPPFRGTGFYEISAAIIRGDRPHLSDVCPSAPPGLSVYFDRALSQRYADRPQTAGQLGRELTALRATLADRGAV
jgi:serine/threonine protein kinase